MTTTTETRTQEQEEYEERAKQAGKEYVALRDRLQNPEGTFDGAKRWYPDETEKQACCRAVRSPSRHWPYSLLVHCRTAEHVANKYDVARKDVLRQR